MHFFATIYRNPTVHILYPPFNRLYYTQKTLPALLESSDTASYQIRIVDNDSTDGTVKYLQKLNHPRIERVIYNNKNEGRIKSTKKIWKETNAELIGKIDFNIRSDSPTYIKYVLVILDDQIKNQLFIPRVLDVFFTSK